MFDQLLFIFNPNSGIDFRGQLLLEYKVNFDIFLVSLESYDRKLFIRIEFLDLDIIWSIYFIILTEVLISRIFC